MSGCGRLQSHLFLRSLCLFPAPSCFSADVSLSSSRYSCLYYHHNTNSIDNGNRENIFGAEKRRGRRRYSANNRNGRSSHIYSIISLLRALPRTETAVLFRKLHPRNKLDVVRFLARRCEPRAAALPTYKSRLFEKRYFFKEEDLCEQSTLGRGPGGQATNRRMQTAIVRHKPSGIIVKFSKFSSYWLNRKAARELLNLRLEEHILGPKSRLGRIKRREEKRRLRRVQITQKLIEKGNVIAAKTSQQRDFYAVLTCAKPFPPLVLLQLGSSYVDRTLYVSDLFEGECNHWWPMLATAFNKINNADGGFNGRCTSDGERDRVNTEYCGNYSELKVPELLYYLFPVALFFPQPANSVERYEWEMIEKCAADEAALRNVLRGFRCFVELFGLCLEETTSSSASSNSGGVLLLTKDGLNWLELQKRMLLCNERMTPLAYACFSHLLLSLTQLRCVREANAILSFFHSEANTGVKENWAAHGLERMLLVSDQASRKLSSTEITGVVS